MWSITLQADKVIEQTDLEDVVESLPMNLQSDSGLTRAVKHDGGWSAVTEISNVNGKVVKVSGGYKSAGRHSSLMAHALKDRLEVKGYRINVDSMCDDASTPSKPKIILL